MKIKVFETIAGYTLYTARDILSSVISKQLPDATLLISDTGTVRISNSGAGRDKYIGSEREAYSFLSALLGKLNEAFGKDASLQQLGIPPLFPKELSLKAVATSLDASGTQSYQMSFDIRKKPSSSEKSTSILNAGLQASISSLGSLTDLYMAWKPIVREKEIERLPVRIDTAMLRKIKNSSPEILYIFYPEKKYITPLYRVVAGGIPRYLPASKYFN